MRGERWRAGVRVMVSVGLGGAAVLGAVLLADASARASGFAAPSTTAPTARGAQAARPVGQPGQAPVRVGGAIAAPSKTRHVNPTYPQEAKGARVQGMVILEVQIDRQGHVSDARVLRSIPMLDQAAIDAVRQWEYTVTQLNGQPVPVIMTVTVNFPLGPEGDAVSGGRSGDAISAERTPFLIEQHRAGVVRSGMSVDDLYHLVPREQTRLVDLFLEGMFSPAIEIRLEPGAEQPAIISGFMLVGAEWRLRGLTVLDERFRTADGLGVGTTVGELMDRHPGLRISHGETHQVIILPQAGVTFRIANDTRNLDEKVRIREARIDAVLLTGVYAPRPPAAR